MLGQDSEKRIFMQMANVTIIGFIFGPLFGSALYSFLGQMNTFFIVGSFFVMLAVIIKMNFNGDAEADMTDCDDSYLGDNQFRYGDELSSFRNDVTPEKLSERGCSTTDYDAFNDPGQH